eukprot:CAMPEP_0170229864 /NCGR_PEP_ID=MMETSP0116_2-20130129/14659_1 /TAXON_ID=400756 /ORGANISM="Durinskia baltica, Strain CSIRO CS-38" /LENGTH=532 /DNA_ID=CAMNT_0010480621 /DNA_START=62 /DNA_END=1659 /DNA_ORIENTATION=-
MPAMKRAMKASDEAKRARKADQVAEHCAVVVAAIGGIPDEVVPEKARNMLASLAERSLQTPAALRHTYQAQVADMVAQAFQDFDRHLSAVLGGDRAKVDNVYGDREARREALAKAEGRVKDLEEARAQKEEAVKACMEARRTKQRELSEAIEAQAAADSTVEGTLKDLEKVKAALQGLELLKGESADSKAGKHALKQVLDAGKPFKVDGSLLESLGTVTKKEPAARGGFDAIVMQNTEEAFTKLLGEFNAVLATSEAPRADRAAATAAAQEALATADAAVQDAKQARDEAGQELKAGEAAMTSAQQFLSDWLLDCKVVMDAYDERVRELDGFRKDAAASFAVLKDLPEGGLKHPEEDTAGGNVEGGEAAPTEAPSAKPSARAAVGCGGRAAAGAACASCSLGIPCSRHTVMARNAAGALYLYGSCTPEAAGGAESWTNSGVPVACSLDAHASGAAGGARLGQNLWAAPTSPTRRCAGEAVRTFASRPAAACCARRCWFRTQTDLVGVRMGALGEGDVQRSMQSRRRSCAKKK